MPSVTFVSHQGRETVVDARTGETIMQIAVLQGVGGIVGECGGSAMCATCHIHVDTDFLADLPPMSEIEDEMLAFTASPRLGTSRLGCQIVLTDKLDGLRIGLPEAQQ